MNRSTVTLGFIAGAFACLALTACDTGQGAAALGDALANQAAVEQQLDGITGLTGSPITTPAGDGSRNQDGNGPGNQDGTGGGNQDGTGGGNQDGTGGGNQDGTGGGNQDGTGGGNQDGTGGGSQDGTGGGNQDGTGGGNQDGTGSSPVASDGVPSIDYAEVVCESDGAGGWHPYLHFTVSDTTGLDVNLNSQGTDDEGGYHNYETSYAGLTGSVPMPYTGCYSEYGEHIYRLSVQGHDDGVDLTEEQFAWGERTISMTGEHHDPNVAVPLPRIDEFVVACVWNAGSSVYDMSLTYSVANATGMALSIDNPGVVGSFGTYGPSGTVEIPNLGCYGENGEQTYDLYTVGGSEPQAVVNLTRVGEHSYTDVVPTTDPTVDPTTDATWAPVTEETWAPATEETLIPTADPIATDWVETESPVLETVEGSIPTMIENDRY